MLSVNQTPLDHSDDVAEYLATGHYNANGWREYPGRTAIECMQSQDRILRDALIIEVKHREVGLVPPSVPQKLTSKVYLRAKLTPMVNGLFPVAERQTVLDLLTNGVVFLTHDVAHTVLKEEGWLPTIHDVASIWLTSIGAEPLAEDKTGLLGLSEATKCYVSLLYFKDLDRDPWADYVVHEAAHMFHNNKRERVGLPLRRRCEWMLDIEFRKRETFAYCCEVYSRILAAARSKSERLDLVERFAENPYEGDETVDPGELVDILREAVSARNGWKRILNRCASPSRRKS